MNAIKLSRFAVVVLLVIAASGCTMDWNARAMEVRTFTAPHAVTDGLDIETRNGRVTVVVDPALDSAAVEAEVRCVAATQAEADERLAATLIDVASLNGTTSMKPIFPDSPRGGDSVSFTIRVPGASDTRVVTSNGRVQLSGISGQVDVTTSNGRIEINDLDGDVVARTSNGRIAVTNVAGAVDLRTSNGRVIVQDVRGETRVSSSNGSVEVALADEAPGPVDIDTSNGNVTLRVGSGFAGIVAMSTSNGRATLEDLKDRASASMGKSRGTVEIGHGGDRSRVSSSNGSVRLVVQ